MKLSHRPVAEDAVSAQPTQRVSFLQVRRAVQLPGLNYFVVC